MKSSAYFQILGRGINGLVTSLLIVLVVLLFTAISLGQAVNDTLSEPSKYDFILKQVRLPSRTQGVLANILVSYSLQTDHNTLLEDVPVQTWEKVAESALPVGWINYFLDDTTNALLLWLGETHTQVPDIAVNLDPIIQTMRGSNGSLAILPLLKYTPTCPLEVKEIIYFTENRLISCLPYSWDLTRPARTIADYIADSLPHEISLLDLYKGGIVQEESMQTLHQIRAGIHTLDSALILGLRISLLSLSLIAVLNSSNLIILLQRLSIPVLIAGGVSLLLIGSSYAFLQWGLKITLTSAFPNLGVTVLALLAELIRMLSFVVVRQWRYWALYLIGSGIILQFLAYSLNKIQHRLAQKALEQPPKQRRIRKQFR